MVDDDWVNEVTNSRTRRCTNTTIFCLIYIYKSQELQFENNHFGRLLLSPADGFRLHDHTSHLIGRRLRHRRQGDAGDDSVGRIQKQSVLRVWEGWLRGGFYLEWMGMRAPCRVWGSDRRKSATRQGLNLRRGTWSTPNESPRLIS